MGAPGASVVGRPVTPAAGSVKSVLPRSGQLLGWFAAATTTLVLYDEGANPAGAAGDQILNVAACAVGWNPFPVDLVNGLACNIGAAVTFVVA